ncbi:hypothetical protein AAVH_09973 [Aphelenchoides avenae]|nr:hypothetical protein AAVH_09973 [Aphelenchus avenae]
MDKEQAQRQLLELLTDIAKNPGEGYYDRTFAELQQRIQEHQEAKRATAGTRPTALNMQTQTEATSSATILERSPLEFILDGYLAKAMQHFRFPDNNWTLTRDAVLDFANGRLDITQAVQKAKVPKDITKALIAAVKSYREAEDTFDSTLSLIAKKYAESVLESAGRKVVQPGDVFSITYRQDSTGIRRMVKPSGSRSLPQNSANASSANPSAALSIGKPTSKTNAIPSTSASVDVDSSADVALETTQIDEPEESPSPARDPTLVAEHLRNETTQLTRKRLHSLKPTEPNEPATDPADAEPLAKPVRDAALKGVRKSPAKKEQIDYSKHMKEDFSLFYCKFGACRQFFYSSSACRRHIARRHFGHTGFESVRTPGLKNNATPTNGSSSEEEVSTDAELGVLQIADYESEHSPSPAKNPTQVADRLRIESSHSIKRCLPFAKKTGLKEPVTESIDEEQEPLAEPTIEEPPAKRVRNATSAVARKPAAKPTKKVVAKPVKQNASSKGSSLKERDDYSEHMEGRDGRFYCTYDSCGKHFPHPSNCRVHIASKHLKHSFRCTVCGYEKPLKQNVYRHLDKHEEVDPAEKGEYIEKIKPPVDEEE